MPARNRWVLADWTGVPRMPGIVFCLHFVDYNVIYLVLKHSTRTFIHRPARRDQAYFSVNVSHTFPIGKRPVFFAPYVNLSVFKARLQFRLIFPLSSSLLRRVFVLSWIPWR